MQSGTRQKERRFCFGIRIEKTLRYPVEIVIIREIIRRKEKIMIILQQIYEKLIEWSLTSGIRIAIILLVSFVLYRFGKSFIERVVRKVINGHNYTSAEAEKKREDTLIGVFNATIRTLILIISLMMILSELGINVGPILAAAGVAGLAFGFGGQYLIRDVISGLFIIMENQYRVGDVVCFDGTCGLVEVVNLRLTIIRDLDGTVHHIPNGEIKKASNLSKDFSRINLNIGIAYSSNLEKVMEIVNGIGNGMVTDPEWKSSIISAPHFVRVEDFADSAIIIKILGDVQPLRQWDVAGELRKRLKIAFDREGVEIPFPQRVMHTAQDIK